MEHYERLTMVHEVYEEVRRYTITTFINETKKPQERQPREAKFIHFFPIILNFELRFKCKHSQVRVKYW